MIHNIIEQHLISYFSYITKLKHNDSMNTICGVVLNIIQKTMYDFAIVMVVIFSMIGTNITTTTNS